jgi:hypothetical protein
MALPNNMFQQVERYLPSALAYLENLNCFISTANTKFKNFEQEVGNLGDTVTFDLPPRFTTADTLVATFQPSVQRVQSLSVDRAKNVSVDYSAQQQIFNLDPMDYLKQFAASGIRQLAATIEKDVAQNCIINHTYRFYGDGTTAINSYGQLAEALALYRDYGSADGDVKFYLPNVKVPAIVNSGLQQFVLDRNQKSARSWMVGDFDNASFFRSNLLPLHRAGNAGNDADTLTVVSTNDPTGANITQITFSGVTASDANCFKAGDLLQFDDGVSGQPDLRFLTFIGQSESASPVQVRVTANAESTAGGQVTVSIYPALQSTSGATQNIAYNIVAGMQASALPDHRAGLIVGGNALYLAMPRLPDEDPFKTVVVTDPKTGVSMRCYYGSQFAQNQRGMVHDCIWGSTMVDEYAMRVIFPV